MIDRCLLYRSLVMTVLLIRLDRSSISILLAHDKFRSIEQLDSIDPLNKTTITSYDEANNIRSITDANQNTISYKYDRLNRQTKAIDANGITTQLTTYDGFGNVKSIKDSGGNRTSYDYDKLNRLTKTIDPRSKETIQSYDGLGRVSRIKDRNHHTRTFAYNINDNLLTESWGDGTTIN